MADHPKRFWQALQTGVDVVVMSSNPQKLLGVRDGFSSFCRQRLSQPVPVTVAHREGGLEGPSLPLSDEETVRLVIDQCRQLKENQTVDHLFFVAAEGGLDCVEPHSTALFFAKYWAAVSCSLGEAVGSGSGLQLPDRLIEGREGSDLPLAVPGRRRRGGMLGSLTAGASTQRDAIADAVFNALSTLFYGILPGGERRPQRRVRFH